MRRKEATLYSSFRKTQIHRNDYVLVITAKKGNSLYKIKLFFN